MFTKLIQGQEKAIIGGLVTGLLVLLGQVGISGQMTVQQALYASVAWIITHIAIWITTNSSKA